MIELRRSEDRGHADHGWLDTHHTFSFASYFDPAHMGFGPLRVLNEDRVAPGQGFRSHPHRDMEIISVVVEGGLEHKDSIGSGSVLRPGDVQVMSAGSGVVHSEFNASSTDPVHFLQIWIEPGQPGGEPTYRERHFDDDAVRGRLACIASEDGRDGSMTIGRDVRVHRAKLENGEDASLALGEGRGAWVQVIAGEVRVGAETLGPGDGAAVTDEAALSLSSASDVTDLLVFDVPV